MIPDFRELFRNDLSSNFRKMTNNFTKNVYMPDIEKEAIMYACSMCIEFKEKAGFLPPPAIIDLTNQVCDVMASMFDEYNTTHRSIALQSVKDNMNLPNIKSLVANYYRGY